MTGFDSGMAVGAAIANATWLALNIWDARHPVVHRAKASMDMRDIPRLIGREESKFLFGPHDGERHPLTWADSPRLWDRFCSVVFG